MASFITPLRIDGLQAHNFGLYGLRLDTTWTLLIYTFTVDCTSWTRRVSRARIRSRPANRPIQSSRSWMARNRRATSAIVIFIIESELETGNVPTAVLCNTKQLDSTSPELESRSPQNRRWLKFLLFSPKYIQDVQVRMAKKRAMDSVNA